MYVNFFCELRFHDGCREDPATKMNTEYRVCRWLSTKPLAVVSLALRYKFKSKRHQPLEIRLEPVIPNPPVCLILVWLELVKSLRIIMPLLAGISSWHSSALCSLWATCFPIVSIQPVPNQSIENTFISSPRLFRMKCLSTYFLKI